MKHLRRILVGTDFSPLGDCALRVAARLARKAEAQVTAVHALAYLPHGHPYEQFENDLTTELISRLKASKAPAHPKWPAIVRTGKPHRVLSAAAEIVDADLVVLGAGSVNQWNELTLGATADRMLRVSHRPVLLVDPRKGDEVPRRLLVAIDPLEDQSRILDRAAALASIAGADVEVLGIEELRSHYPHLEKVGPVVSDFWHALGQARVRDEGAGPSEFEGDLIRKLEQQVKDSPLSELATPVGTKFIKAPGAHEGILREAASGATDLIVVGTHVRNPIAAAILGSTAERVAKSSPCHLLVVP